MLLEKISNGMTTLLKELQETGSNVVLYGASDAGRNYVDVLHTHNISINCFVDDDIKKQGKTYCGIKIVSPDEFIEHRRGDEIILVASYSPSVIIHKIREKYPFLYESVRWSDFYLWENELDYLHYYMENMEKIDRVKEILCDEKSKQVFQNLLNYKISRNRSLIKEIQDNGQEQYFSSDIIKFMDREVFLDLGAYTGDTINGFCKAVCDKYAKIIAVEPDEANFKQLKDNTRRLEEIEYHQVGIAEKDGMARFAAQALYTSHFDEKGEQEIKTRSVDSIMGGREATFIKADIEGLEMEMLRGAVDTIRSYKPKLAIAVYHKKDDIFKIPLLLQSYREDYSFFMRHYTEMPIDTVLYAI